MYLAIIVYLLCLLACALCTWLLARSYFRVPNRLLFWSAACFAMLGVNNLVVAANIAIAPERDYSILANFATLIALSFLLYGFIWEDE